ncbi:hypothetical protein ACLH3T_001582 [Flavobacterium psychrophilum]
MKKRKFNRIKKPTNKPEEKHKQIVDFCLIVKNFFPKEIITNNEHEYYQNLIETLHTEEQQIVNLLIHHLTKLFQNHRIIRNKRIIEIAEEDILTALEITGNMLNPKAFLTRIQRQHYVQLTLAFKTEIFTVSQAQRILQSSKTNTARMLNLLTQQGLLNRIKRKEKQAYLYSLNS